MIHTIFNPSKDSLIQQSADLLTQFINAPEVLLLLSGGSALEILNKVDAKGVGKNLTISVLDERYTQDSSVNNFYQIMNTPFYTSVVTKGASLIDTRVADNETVTQLADRFEHDLRNWKTAHPHGTIVATQGVGPDGHTAGIMPYPENNTLFTQLFCDENRWVVGYDAGNKNQFPLRVTTTIPFLKMIDHSVILMTGENKKEALMKSVDTASQLYEVPAKIIQEMKDVYVFTDQKM